MVLAVFSFEKGIARVKPLIYDCLSDLPEIEDISVLDEVKEWCVCQLFEINDGVILGLRDIRYKWYKVRCYLSRLLTHLEKTLPLLDFSIDCDLLYIRNVSGSICTRISLALFYQDDPDYSKITEAILHRILHHITGAHTHADDGMLRVIPEEEEPAE